MKKKKKKSMQRMLIVPLASVRIIQFSGPDTSTHPALPHHERVSAEGTRVEGVIGDNDAGTFGERAADLRKPGAP